MDKRESIVLLDAMATNLTGELALAQSDEQAALLQRYIAAIDTAIESMRCARGGDGIGVRLTSPDTTRCDGCQDSAECAYYNGEFPLRCPDAARYERLKWFEDMEGLA